MAQNVANAQCSEMQIEGLRGLAVGVDTYRYRYRYRYVPDEKCSGGKTITYGHLARLPHLWEAQRSIQENVRNLTRFARRGQIIWAYESHQIEISTRTGHHGTNVFAYHQAGRNDLIPRYFQPSPRIVHHRPIQENRQELIAVEDTVW
jgi:hypothetical protein